MEIYVLIIDNILCSSNVIILAMEIRVYDIPALFALFVVHKWVKKL